MIQQIASTRRITATAAAAILGVSRQRVFQLRRDGLLVGFAVPRAEGLAPDYVYDEADVKKLKRSRSASRAAKTRRNREKGS